MKRNTQSTIDYTLEEFPFTGEFGPDLITVEVSIAYSISPYDLGCRYTSNGDGWPPSGGEVEDVEFTVKSAVSYDEMGEELRFSQAEFPAIVKAINEHFDADEKFRNRIDELCIEDAGDRASDDDGDARYEAARDRRNELRHEAGQRESQ